MIRVELGLELRKGRRSTLAWAVCSCMYAYRKPFTAAMYPGEMVWGVGEKTALVTA